MQSVGTINRGKPSAAILAGRCRQMLLEGSLKMRLIGKPGFQRDIRDQLAAAQALAGKLDALVDQKRVGRHAVMLFESADQVRR